MKKKLFLVASILLLAVPVFADYQYVCTWDYTEVSYDLWVDEHWEYDAYTDEYWDIPGGYESFVTGTWYQDCQWEYFPDPPTTPPDPNQPPIITPASLWVISVDPSDPNNVHVNLGAQGASDVSCDMNQVRMYIGGQNVESLDGPFPYTFTMGHFRLADYNLDTDVQFDGFDPCNGYTGSTSFHISRTWGNKNTSGSVTFTYFDQVDDMVVPVAYAFGRTFSQSYLQTSFNVDTVNGGIERYQLTDSADAIAFGNQALLPGEPTYAQTWHAQGTSIGDFSEHMVDQGWDFASNMVFARPQSYGPAFGFEPTVSVDFNQFSWNTDNGLVPCLVTNGGASITVWPY